MASVASPVRASTGSGPLTQHSPQLPTGEGFEHPQPQPTDSALAAASPPAGLAAAALPAVQIQPELTTYPFAEHERFQAGGFFRRATAALIDLAVLLPVCGLAGLALCLLFGQPIPRLAELSPDLLLAALLDSSPANEALLALSAILFFLYFFVFHASRGQTPGKKVLGLRVIDAYGERPRIGRTLLRTASYVLSLLPCSLGFLWIGFDRERRALHDWVAGTYVVRVL